MFLGPFYEQGLQSLKERIEGRPDLSVEIALNEVEAVSYAGFQTTSANSSEAIGQAMADGFGSIMANLAQNGVQMDGGYPLAVYTSYSDSAIAFTLTISFLGLKDFR